MNQPNGESIWGNINTCMEIAINIYMIVAKDKNGNEKTGIMAHKDSVGDNLSKKAADMAVQDGDWLCFDEKTKDIPMLEILQSRIAMCKRIENQAIKQIEEMKRDSKLNLTDYVPECEPPRESKVGSLFDATKVCNGVFFTSDNENFQFAVHESIADNYMTPMAAELAQKQGEYLFYDTTSAAVPLNELKNVFDECDALIVSADSLYATLNQHFAPYTMAYNDIMQEKNKIPEIIAPTNLFLRVQLEQTEATLEEQVEVAAEQDFNEETDFEIGDR